MKTSNHIEKINSFYQIAKKEIKHSTPNFLLLGDFIRCEMHEKWFVLLTYYLRWVDDIVDSNASKREKLELLRREKRLLTKFYKNRGVKNLLFPERVFRECVWLDICHSLKFKQILIQFIRYFFEEAKRRNEIISKKELYPLFYCKAGLPLIIVLFLSNLDVKTFFKGRSFGRLIKSWSYYFSIIHNLRDLEIDLENGIINIPREYINKGTKDARVLLMNDAGKYKIELKNELSGVRSSTLKFFLNLLVLGTEALYKNSSWVKKFELIIKRPMITFLYRNFFSSNCEICKKIEI